jgi:hypothetical protein
MQFASQIGWMSVSWRRSVVGESGTTQLGSPVLLPDSESSDVDASVPLSVPVVPEADTEALVGVVATVVDSSSSPPQPGTRATPSVKAQTPNDSLF